MIVSKYPPLKAQNMCSNDSYPAWLPDRNGYVEIGVVEAIQAHAAHRWVTNIDPGSVSEQIVGTKACRCTENWAL